ncbi:MAG: ABC transporter permease [Candidatus Saccharimonadales bacterium]
MLASLKAEFRKLFTVRSTYWLSGFVLVFVAFLSTYVFGYRQEAFKADNPLFMVDVIYSMISTFILLGTIVGILLIAHEYRYNTIFYTITSSNSRLKVLISKVLVLLFYITAMTCIVAVVTYVSARIGLSFANATLVPQTIDWWSVTWKFVSFVWLYALVGFFIAVLVRGVVPAIAIYLAFPVVEQMLVPLLKDNAGFLPFNAIGAIAATTPNGVGWLMLTPLTALGVSITYIIVLSTISTVLFVRRDAN